MCDQVCFGRSDIFIGDENDEKDETVNCFNIDIQDDKIQRKTITKGWKIWVSLLKLSVNDTSLLKDEDGDIKLDYHPTKSLILNFTTDTTYKTDVFWK